MLSRMSSAPGFLCSCCGERHGTLPSGYGTLAPVHWREELAGDPASLLTGEQCVIENQHFFLRARIILPVLDADHRFEWGVWVSVSRKNYYRAGAMWGNPDRAAEPPYFGWLATDLPIYDPPTVNLKTQFQTQAPGIRPTVELEPTEHPLAVEQHSGITAARIQEIAEIFLHPELTIEA
jgi:hypothetical protein